MSDDFFSKFDHHIFSLISKENWDWLILAIIMMTLVVNFIVGRVLDKLKHQVEKTHNIWDDALLQSAYLPLRLIGWLVGLSLILAVLHKQHSIEIISSIFFQFRKIAFVVVIALFVYRLIYHIHQGLITSNECSTKTNDKLDPASLDAISKLLRLSVVIVTSLTILQVLGYSVSGILAFGGLGGIAVGFAAKDLLANFFGGLTIYLDKPFKIGDWIRSPDRDIEGVVETIGWRISCIRTFDKRPLYIPNSLFTNIIVENPSRMSNRRIKENIGIRYDDWLKMEAIVSDVKKMLQNHPDIDNNQTLICNFNAFNASSIDFLIYTFTKTTNWIAYHQIKQDVLLKIFAIIDSHGAEIAFPTQTLFMADNKQQEQNYSQEENRQKKNRQEEGMP